MRTQRRSCRKVQYSPAFKRKVVDEIERGELTVGEAKRLYDITGSMTISSWLTKHGKQHLLNHVVHVAMKNEQDTVQEQKKKIQQLQAALSEAHLRILVLESTVTVLEQAHGKAEKKSTSTLSSRKP